MQRPDERELLAQVLAELKDLPEGLDGRLAQALDSAADDRADVLRKVFEEFARG